MPEAGERTREKKTEGIYAFLYIFHNRNKIRQRLLYIGLSYKGII